MKQAFKLLTMLAFLLLPCVCGAEGSAPAEGWLNDFVLSMKNDATNGVVEAQLTLGVKYSEGQGVAQDYAEARQWLEMAAGQKNAQAFFCLGEIYEEGHGVSQDYKQSMGYYQNAAFNGSAEAMFRFGDMLAESRGVTQDKTKTVDWFGRVCRVGHRISCGRYRKLTEANC